MLCNGKPLMHTLCNFPNTLIVHARTHTHSYSHTPCTHTHAHTLTHTHTHTHTHTQCCLPPKQTWNCRRSGETLPLCPTLLPCPTLTHPPISPLSQTSHCIKHTPVSTYIYVHHSGLFVCSKAHDLLVITHVAMSGVIPVYVHNIVCMCLCSIHMYICRAVNYTHACFFMYSECEIEY